MTNLLNEEIHAIKLYMSHLEKAIPLEVDTGKKHKMKQDYLQLKMELSERLMRCGDFKG